jgi:hypothetical protein
MILVPKVAEGIEVSGYLTDSDVGDNVLILTIPNGIKIACVVEDYGYRISVGNGEKQMTSMFCDDIKDAIVSIERLARMMDTRCNLQGNSNVRSKQNR